MHNAGDKQYNLGNLLARFRAFLAAGNKSTPNTIKNYLSDLRHFLGWVQMAPEANISANTTEEALFETMTTDLIEEYRDYLLAKHAPLKTINRRLSSIRKLMQLAIEEKIITTNMAKLVPNVPDPIAESPKSENNVPAVDESAQESEAGNHPNVRSKVITLLERNEAKIMWVYGAVGLVLVIVASLFGASIQSIFSKTPKTYAALPSQNTFSRTLRYEGVLKDKNGLAITKVKNGVLRLYDSQKRGKLLYSSGTCQITPSADGHFTVELGKDCGKAIPVSVFTTNSDVYLGLTIEKDQEMRPRQHLPSVGYAFNSHTLQGLPLGGAALQVPFVDKEGVVVLDSPTPSLQSKDETGTFVISSAHALTLQSAGIGDVTISALEAGSIKFLAGGVELGRFSNFGRFGIGTQTPDVKFEVQDSLEQFRITYGPNEYTSFRTLSDGDFRLSPTGNDTILPDRLIVGSETSSSTQTTFEVSGTGHIRGSSGRTGLFVSSSSLVGIGTTNPGKTLDVSGTGQFSSTLTASDGLTLSTGSLNLTSTSGRSNLTFDTSTTALTLQSGLVTLDTSNSRVGIGTTAPTSTLQVVGGNCSDEAGGGGCTADYAELYPSSEPVEKGDIVVVDKESPSYMVKRSTLPYELSIVGVVSTTPAAIIDGGSLSFMHNTYELDERKPAIALAGRVPVNVAADSAPILPGDRITSSTSRGKAQKATKAGHTIGIALEKWTPGMAQVLLFVSPGYFDPHVMLASDGSLTIVENDEVYNGIITSEKKADERRFSLFGSAHELIEKAGFYSQLTIASTTTGLLKATDLVTENLQAGITHTDELVTRVAKVTNASIDTLFAKKITSESIQTKTLEAESVKTESAVAKSIQTQLLESTEASISGTLNAQTIHTESVNVDGTITADTVEAKNISALRERLQEISQNQSESGQKTHDLAQRLDSVSSLLEKESQELPTETHEIAQLNPDSTTGSYLTSSTFFDATVLGVFTAGSVAVERNEILSLENDLKLTALETIRLFDDKVVIANDGTITTKGNIIAKGVTIENLTVKNSEGRSVAHVGEDGMGQFSGLALKTSTPSAILASERDAKETTSALETNAAAAGTGILLAGEEEIVLYNSQITDTSLVYITPTSSTENQPLYISEKKSCPPGTPVCRPSFTVSVDTPVSKDISFNWWILQSAVDN